MQTLVRIVYCLVFFACVTPAENRRADAPTLPESTSLSTEALTLSVPKANQVPLVADAVITASTAYYVSGPQQSRPPEGQFDAGTRVTIAKRNGAYLLVTDKKGLTAWVNADAVSREPTPRTNATTKEK